uniref:Ubiquitin-like protease family profile domain-containing protein n=1 Tax=Brassica oleracea var. oleracea TaxID=109376 RepID=A0A0D3CIU8_BRAOL
MELELPKRLYAEGSEPRYDDVKTDPVFTHIMAIAENDLKFSRKLVDSFICRQLITSKLHEKWFVFARTPLRFSLLEYHVVTGLKITRETNSDVVKWKNDGVFWSNLLHTGGKITLQSIRKVHLQEVHTWTRLDKMRLIYLCVIVGVVMGRDEKVSIPHMYIKLVMDFDKVRKFHWGLHSYDFLLSSIEKAMKKLGKKESYIFEGFSYALQIWIMEAIPDFGEILGRRVSDSFKGPRCGNWKGVAKVSYEDIIELEDSLTKKANRERVFTERMGKMEIDVSQLRDAISLTGEGNYPSKKEAEEAPLNIKAKKAPPKSKGAQAPPKSKGAQAPSKRKGDQPTPTKKIWNINVDRLYVPVHVSGNHWIALCIIFVTRSIDVFACSGRKRYKEVDGFANLIPRIVKAGQPMRHQKDFAVGAYTVSYVPVGNLNKSACDCGVYAVKFIECHALGLELSLLHDGNIIEARHRILWDLWEAANDLELIDRMSKYQSPECLSSTVEEIL